MPQKWLTQKPLLSVKDKLRSELKTGKDKDRLPAPENTVGLDRMAENAKRESPALTGMISENLSDKK